jgi:hypothetical protein
MEPRGAVRGEPGRRLVQIVLAQVDPAAPAVQRGPPAMAADRVGEIAADKVAHSPGGDHRFKVQVRAGHRTGGNGGLSRSRAMRSVESVRGRGEEARAGQPRTARDSTGL